MTKLQVGITGALAVAASTGLVVQARTNASLRAEVAELHRQNAEVSILQAENLKLARTVAEAEALRKEGPEFAQMTSETVELNGRLKAVAQRRAAAASTNNVYDLAALDQLPKPRFRTPPSYPLELRRAGITGEVTVDFVVDQDGAVKNARAVKATRPEFEAVAVEAVSKWLFDAGLKGGRVVNTHMQVPIIFALSDQEPTSGEPVPVPVSPNPAPSKE